MSNVRKPKGESNLALNLNKNFNKIPKQLEFKFRNSIMLITDYERKVFLSWAKSLYHENRFERIAEKEKPYETFIGYFRDQYHYLFQRWADEKDLHLSQGEIS